MLADLKRDDPKFAFLVTRLVGLYRRLWESCVSKHIDGQKLQQSNQILREAGTHLRKERDGLQLHHKKQVARLRFFEQALESSRERLISLHDDWNYPSNQNWQGCQTLQEKSKELPIPGCPVLYRQHRNTTSGDAVQGKLHRMQSRLYIPEAFNKKGTK